MMKNISIFLFFLCFSVFHAQQKDLEKITYFLDKSNEYSAKDDLKSLEYAKKASLLAEKINHSFKKAESYLWISKCLYVLGSYKESLAYIEKGLKEDAVIKDHILTSGFKEVLALDYFATGLEEQGLKEYSDIVNIVKSKTDEESIRILSRTYAEIGAIYLNQENFKAGHQYLDKAIKTNMKVPVEGHINERADIYNIKGYLCLYDNKEDSAFYYYKKSFAEIEKDKSINKYVQFTALGDYYYQKKQYEKALENYLKALADIKKYNLNKLEYSMETIKNISEIYGILKNPEKEKEYLLDYQKKSHLLQKATRKDFQASVNLILSQKAEEISFFRKKSNVIILLLLFSFLVVFTVVYLRFQRKNNIKKKALQEAKQELDLKHQIILQRDDEKKNLENKLNDAFEEVMQLARKNDPSFLARFKEVYPEFCENLLKINPDMVNSELIFCAYLKLNLTSKEIANYTFVTHKAIELRKNRFRKKMNIPSEENLYVWIDKI